MAILDADTVQFSGVCAIHGKEQGIAAELSIWLKKNAPGKNLGRETIALLVQWAKYTLRCPILFIPLIKTRYLAEKLPSHWAVLWFLTVVRNRYPASSLISWFYQVDGGVEVS